MMSDMYRPVKEKDLMPLGAMKFLFQFYVLICITAYYLNVVTANNPWSTIP